MAEASDSEIGEIRYRLGSLCTGYGGLDQAIASLLSVRLAWVSDIDKDACTFLAHRFPTVPNLGDLKAIDFAAIEPIDVLCAGYPCQPFSHAGKRKGTDDPRHLWPWIADAVRVLRPRYLIAENVSAHLGLGFDTVLADLAGLGFDVEWGVLRASDVGACHQRKRLFFVASNADHHGDAQRGRVARGVAGEAGEGTPGVGQRQRLRDAPRHPRQDAPDADGGRLEERGEHDGRTEQPGLGAPRRSDADRLGAAPTDPANLGHERSRDARRGRLGPADSGVAVAHANAPGSQGSEPAGRRVLPSWGDYEPAIRRHERAVGRPAPLPTDDRGRLSPRFVEWMMMLADGWVTDMPGIARTGQLKMLGNGVVPLQAAAALSVLLPESELVAA